MSKLILCTVGTSVLEPRKYEGAVFEDLQDLYDEILPEVNMPRQPVEDIINSCMGIDVEAIVEQQLQFMEASQVTVQTRELSAEISTLMRLCRIRDSDESPLIYGPLENTDRVIFLYSDTPEGGLAALINSAIVERGFIIPEACEDADQFAENLMQPSGLGMDAPIENNRISEYHFDPNRDITKTGICTSAVRINGLRAVRNDCFKVGIENLIKVVAHYGDNGGDLKVFMLTGGYKATTPVADLAAASRGFTRVFLHENGEELLRSEAPEGFSNLLNCIEIIRSQQVCAYDQSNIDMSALSYYRR